MWRDDSASLLDTRVERTLLNMNASETSQIVRYWEFLTVITVRTGDNPHCCPDLYPGESRWSWKRCPLPRLGHGAKMEPSWLTWHGKWSQTQKIFWNFSKHLKQFQNVLENSLTMLRMLENVGECSHCWRARLCWSRHGNQDLDGAGWLEVGAGNSQRFHFLIFIHFQQRFTLLLQALASAGGGMCCDMLWLVSELVAMAGKHSCVLGLLQACAAGFGLPCPHTENRREARFACPLWMKLLDLSRRDRSILPSQCDLMFRIV